MDFKDKIKEITKAKITKTNLAKELGISRPTLDKKIEEPERFTAQERRILSKYEINI